MNKTTKHYFINMFKRKKKLLALYTFVCFMGYPFLEIASSLTNGNSGLLDVTEVCFTLALITLGILSALLPIFTFKFSQTKKNVDTYFALPINRNHLFKAHFLGPILGACVPILINYVIGGTILVISVGDISLFFQLLFLLFIAFAVFASVYSINTFFVLNCNNILDAAIVTVTIALLPLVFVRAVVWFVDIQTVNTGMIEFNDLFGYIIKLLCPYSGFTLLSFGMMDDYAWRTYLKVGFENIEWGYIIYYFVLGVISYFLSKKVFHKRKGEDVEQLTTSFVTYPLLINVGLVALVMLFNLIDTEFVYAILIIVALFVVFVIANGIANRSMEVNLKMIIKFVVLLVVVNGFNYVSRQTEFFGINRRVIDYKNYDVISVDYYSYDGENYYESYFNIEPSTMNGKEEEFFEFVEKLQIQRSKNYKETGFVDNDEPQSGHISVQYGLKNKDSNVYARIADYNLSVNEGKIFDQLSKELAGE